jgi:hypothetical protein
MFIRYLVSTTQVLKDTKFERDNLCEKLFIYLCFLGCIIILVSFVAVLFLVLMRRITRRMRTRRPKPNQGILT